MAKPTTFSASKLYIKLGNGGSPEVFAEPCGLTTRGLTQTKDVNDIVVPDCANPDLPAWVERAVRSLSAEATGSGILAAEALPTWQSAFASTASVNAQIGINAPPANNGGHYDGKIHLTSFAVTGELGDKLQVALTFQTDGPLTWVPAP